MRQLALPPPAAPTRPTLRHFQTVRATFRPTRTDNLRPGAHALIGRRLEWRTMWRMDEDDPSPGQWALEPTDRDLWCGWVPECDLVFD